MLVALLESQLLHSLQAPQQDGIKQPSGCQSPLVEPCQHEEKGGIRKSKHEYGLETGITPDSFPSTNFFLPPQVRFSDEKRFAFHSDQPVRVWRYRGERYKARFTAPAKKFSKSVMMWLCIAADGSSRLLRCDPLQDSASYQNTVLSKALPFIRPPRSSACVVFMQDGASCHRSASTLSFLAKNRVKLLPDWPANSPDCNPVEHCWAWIAKRLAGRAFLTEEELEAAIREEWEGRPPTLIPNLYGSMIRRLTAVLVARGAATRF